MANMRSFFSGGGSQNRAKSFEASAAGKSKQDVRELEEAMLQPEPIADYAVERPHPTSIVSRSVKLVFKDDIAFNLFKKHFNVRNYVCPNVSELELLTALLLELESGRITFSKKEGRITYNVSSKAQPAKRTR